MPCAVDAFDKGRDPQSHSQALTLPQSDTVDPLMAADGFAPEKDPSGAGFQVSTAEQFVP